MLIDRKQTLVLPPSRVRRQPTGATQSLDFLQPIRDVPPMLRLLVVFSDTAAIPATGLVAARPETAPADRQARRVAPSLLDRSEDP